MYWGSTAALGGLAALVLWYAVRWQRGYADLAPADVDQLHYAGVYPAVGWALHYVPFMAMGRVTYVHHYYPALYFAILAAGFCLDWTARGASRPAAWALHAAAAAAVVALFCLFRAICFGMEGPSAQWRHLKWFDSWRITD